MESKKCYLFFSGYYSVAYSSELLRLGGIENRIVKAPVYMRNSCSFALMVNEADIEKSSLLLEQNGVTAEKKVCC